MTIMISQKELLQQIFDAGVNGVLEQGVRCDDDDDGLACYMNEKGHRDIIAFSLPTDDKSVEKINSLNHQPVVGEILELLAWNCKVSEEFLGQIGRGLSELQVTHDNTNGCSKNDYCHNFLVECEAFAKSYNLTMDNINFELVHGDIIE